MLFGTAILVGTLFGGAVGFGATVPTTPQVGGVVNVFAESNGSKPGRIVLIGAIGDSGTTTNVNANGKVDPKGDYIKLTLSRDDRSQSDRALPAARQRDPIVHRGNLLGVVRGYLPGTPDRCHRGISRNQRQCHLDLYRGGRLLPRYASGTKKGQCNLNGNPTREQGLVMGSGTVAFSG